MVQAHAMPEVAEIPCPACNKSKNMLHLVGGDEVRVLFIHVGQIADTDNWEHNFSRNEKTAKPVSSQV